MNLVLSSADLHKILERVFDRGYSGENAALITKHRMAVGFYFSSPVLNVIVDGRSDPVQVLFDPPSSVPLPDVSFSMAGQTIHRFWTGELNVVAAMTRGEVTARGNLIRALHLFPMMPVLQEAYREEWEMWRSSVNPLEGKL